MYLRIRLLVRLLHPVKREKNHGWFGIDRFLLVLRCEYFRQRVAELGDFRFRLCLLFCMWQNTGKGICQHSLMLRLLDLLIVERLR